MSTVNSPLDSSTLDSMDHDDQKAAITNARKGNIKVGGIEATKLKSYIDRIERLEGDREGIASDIRDVFTEAKSNGFDNKTMRSVLKLRKLKPNDRSEAEYMLDLYKRALGMDHGIDEEEAA